MSNYEKSSVDDEEYLESLNASVDPLRPPDGTSREEWLVIQRARTEYLKEWEEDLRYAVELANEGM